jgi:hypothetical protein
MPVLINDRSRFWRSFWSFHETAPARFGGRYSRTQRRPQPVLAVVLIVLQNGTGPFLRLFWSFHETALARFDRHFGSTTHAGVRQMLGFIVGIKFLILLCLFLLDVL